MRHVKCSSLLKTKVIFDTFSEKNSGKSYHKKFAANTLTVIVTSNYFVNWKQDRIVWIL